MSEDTPPAKRANECTDDGPVKRPRCDYSRTIKILVGHNRFPFIVHKDVICIKSSFIRAHFEQRSDDSPEDGMLLSEIRPADFELYVDWAYEKTLDTATTSNAPMTGLIRLYMLGEQLEDEALCQKAMQQLSSRLCNCDMCFLFAESNNTKSMCEVWDNVEVIWAETKAESMLRRWLVDVTIARGREVDFEGRLGGGSCKSSRTRFWSSSSSRRRGLITVLFVERRLSILLDGGHRSSSSCC